MTDRERDLLRRTQPGRLRAWWYRMKAEDWLWIAGFVIAIAVVAFVASAYGAAKMP